MGASAIHPMTFKDTLVTRREVDVWRLLALGCSNKEVAFLLKISRKTADTHTTSLMRKINVCNRAQLVLAAVRNGVVDVEMSDFGEPRSYFSDQPSA